MYELEFEPLASEGLRKLKRDDPQAYRKAAKLLEELINIQLQVLVIRISFRVIERVSGHVPLQRNIG